MDGNSENRGKVWGLGVKGLAAAGQHFVNSVSRKIRCAVGKKNTIKERIRNILDLLGNHNTYKKRFLDVLNMHGAQKGFLDTDKYKAGISLFIQIFQSIKKKYIHRDLTSFFLSGSSGNKSNFDRLATNFINEINMENIKKIIEYLKEIRGEVDCFCKKDLAQCKMTLEEYLKPPQTSIVVNDANEPQTEVKDENEVNNSLEQKIYTSYTKIIEIVGPIAIEKFGNSVEFLKIIGKCASIINYFLFKNIYNKLSNNTFKDEFKLNVGNLITFLNNIHADKNKSDSQLKSLFSRMEINLSEDNIKSLIKYINELNQNIESCSDQNCLNADLKEIIDENKNLSNISDINRQLNDIDNSFAILYGV